MQTPNMQKICKICKNLLMPAGPLNPGPTQNPDRLLSARSVTVTCQPAGQGGGRCNRATATGIIALTEHWQARLGTVVRDSSR